jgi:hypothetical protein
VENFIYSFKRDLIILIFLYYFFHCSGGVILNIPPLFQGRIKQIDGQGNVFKAYYTVTFLGCKNAGLWGRLP